jgi:hypothetical protein
MMEKPTKLRSALVSAFEHLKSQDGLIFALRTELTALRELLMESRPDRIIRFQQLLAAQLESETKTVSDSQQLFDAIIEQLKASDTGWVN